MKRANNNNVIIHQPLARERFLFAHPNDGAPRFRTQISPIYHLVTAVNSPTCYARPAANVSSGQFSGRFSGGMREIGQILVAAQKRSLAGTSIALCCNYELQIIVLIFLDCITMGCTIFD